MLRRLTPLATLLATATLAAPTYAQSTGGNPFRMFFFPVPNNPSVLDWVGVLMVWTILLMSVGVVGLVLQYYMRFRRVTMLPDETRQQVEQLLAEKRYKEAIDYASADTSYLGRIVSAGLGEASNGFGAMERAIEETGDNETTKMLRPLEYLNILGNVGPMLGLFGTVYGIILAFNQLMMDGGKVDPGKLAGGISTALVTTFWGLIVAMPAISAYALLRNKVDEITVEGIMVAEDIIKPFRPASAKKAASGTPTGGATASGGTGRGMATPKPNDPA